MQPVVACGWLVEPIEGRFKNALSSSLSRSFSSRLYMPRWLRRVEWVSVYDEGPIHPSVRPSVHRPAKAALRTCVGSECVSSSLCVLLLVFFFFVFFPRCVSETFKNSPPKKIAILHWVVTILFLSIWLLFKTDSHASLLKVQHCNTKSCCYVYIHTLTYPHVVNRLDVAISRVLYSVLLRLAPITVSTLSSIFSIGLTSRFLIVLTNIKPSKFYTCQYKCISIHAWLNGRTSAKIVSIGGATTLKGRLTNVTKCSLYEFCRCYCVSANNNTCTYSWFHALTAMASGRNIQPGGLLIPTEGTLESLTQPFFPIDLLRALPRKTTRSFSFFNLKESTRTNFFFADRPTKTISRFACCDSAKLPTFAFYSLKRKTRKFFVLLPLNGKRQPK